MEDKFYCRPLGKLGQLTTGISENFLLPLLDIPNAWSNTEPSLIIGASLIAQLVKNLPAMLETLVQFLSQEDQLEKG